MRIKSVVPGLLAIILVAALFGWKAWEARKENVHGAIVSTQIKGPAVILFRGDNSADCRAIKRLVDQAAVRYGQSIHFVQQDWSDDNPLIQKYQVHFLPTVVFVDGHGTEAGRLVGESPAVQQKLEKKLAHLDELLGP